MPGGSGSTVIDRDAEQHAIRQFLDQAARQRAALILTGEAGIGKTVLLRAGAAETRERGGFILACGPTGTEAPLAFAALTDLLSNTVDDEAFAALPTPQREALEVALLLKTAGPSPIDQRVISAGVLSLLRAIARREPLMLILDDLQWLDAESASALAYATRRLRDEERIGVLASVRKSEAKSAQHDLVERLAEFGRQLDIGPLDVSTIGRIVAQALGRQLPINALRKIERVSGGNPLFALQIARGMVEERSLDEGAERLVAPADLQDALRTRLGMLSDPGRRALLVVSALSHPTSASVSSAGVGAGLKEALTADIVRLDGGVVRFEHPLFASVLYQDAPNDERRSVHAVLADIVEDPEERARHVALAASDRDDRIAEAVERGGLRARLRGATGSAAELFDHAARLTPRASASEANRRRVLQAEALFVAGEERRAQELMSSIVESMEPGQARAETLLRLAEMLIGFDVPRAMSTFSDAIEERDIDDGLRSRIRAGLAMNHYVIGSLLEAERNAEEAVKLAEPSGDPVNLANALTVLAEAHMARGRPDAFELFDRAVALEPALEAVPVGDLPSFMLGNALSEIDELDGSRAVFARLLELCTAHGDDLAASMIHAQSAFPSFWAGDLEAAETHLSAPSTALGHGWWQTLFQALSALIQGCLGHLDLAREGARDALDASEREDDIPAVLECRQALGFIELSASNHAQTVRYLEPAWELLQRAGFGEPSMYKFPADLAESLVALGRLDEAEPIIRWLAERGRALGRPWAIGAAARGRGLVLAAERDLSSALEELRRASDAHRRIQIPLERGRTLLVRGRIARRAKRKREAREALEEAVALFERLPAPVWVEHATNELSRISGRRPSPSRLTPTEERIARLAAAGRTNQEIADALFLSIRTVESHLSRTYAKLGIRSRIELASALDAASISQ
jgi:DNA-binding CsgD family transcriptional regulator